jgi:hypothetical protein
MTTNVPQDVLEDALLAGFEVFKRPDGSEGIETFDAGENITDDLLKFLQLRDQRQQGAEPVLYARSNELAEPILTERQVMLTVQNVPDDIYDAPLYRSPPQANALVAAAYRKAAETVFNTATVMPVDQLTRKIFSDAVMAAIPADAEAALLEYVRPYVEILKAAKCPNCDGSGAIPVETVRVGMGCCGMPNPDNSCCGNAIPIPEPDMELQECQWCSERTAIVNSVLGEGGK